MSLPTTTARVAAKRQLVKLIADRAHHAGDDIAVEYGLPQTPPKEVIAVLNVTATRDETPYMVGGRTKRRDTFTVVVGCFAYLDGQTCIESERRVEQFIGYVENALATNATLRPLEGITSALVTNIDGPNSDGTTEGYLAYGFVDIEIVQQLT